MKDVAAHAGVSLSTVSYVVNDSGPVASDRRSRVLDAIRILNYTPNESARSLKRRSASTIGLILPELANQYFALVAEGIERAASDADVLVVLCVPQATGKSDDFYAQLLRSQRLDGVVYLSATGTLPSLILELSRSGAVVLVDEQMPGFELPAVVSDNRRGAREIAQHVIEAGHRQIALIGGPAPLWSADQRLAGYREALAAAGQDPDEVPFFGGDYRQRAGYEQAAKALEVAPADRPTALICANDLMAFGALEYCRASGIAVPSELSIVGFDDIPTASLVTPRLTTVRQPAHDLGFAAARLLFSLIDDEGEATPPMPFPTALMVRDSVAPPR
ncbi:MAG: LacI family DNA-binding transcriptional regulator [Actinobacteria bacterium]|nr:LacI family DNA-binding transcriptional regulator [Actinomycetota bacterium]